MDEDLKFLNENILTIIKHKIHSKNNNLSTTARIILKNLLTTRYKKEYFKVIKEIYNEGHYYSLKCGGNYLNRFIYEDEISDLKMMVRNRKINGLKR